MEEVAFYFNVFLGIFGENLIQLSYVSEYCGTPCSRKVLLDNLS